MQSKFYKSSILDKQIDALINAGYYSTKSEIITDALRFLFSKRHDLRIASAIELYIEGKVSLSRAAEIAGVITEEFKDILSEKGIKIKIEPLTEEELSEGIDIIKQIREKKK